jgi:hypothetical protein
MPQRGYQFVVDKTKAKMLRRGYPYLNNAMVFSQGSLEEDPAQLYISDLHTYAGSSFERPLRKQECRFFFGKHCPCYYQRLPLLSAPIPLRQPANPGFHSYQVYVERPDLPP